MVKWYVKAYTSKGCSITYIFLSIWAILFLGVLAVLFKTEKYGNIGISKDEDIDKYFKVCLYACIAYVILLLLCIFNFVWRSSHPFPKEANAVVASQRFRAPKEFGIESVPTDQL